MLCEKNMKKFINLIGRTFSQLGGVLEHFQRYIILPWFSAHQFSQDFGISRLLCNAPLFRIQQKINNFSNRSPALQHSIVEDMHVFKPFFKIHYSVRVGHKHKANSNLKYIFPIYSAFLSWKRILCSFNNLCEIADHNYWSRLVGNFQICFV